MRRHVRPTRLLAMFLVALLAGCAHTPAIPPESWRSPEGFQGATWGMTPGDLGARLDGAALVDPHTYRTHEVVDGKPASVTYAFPGGHLSTVTVQFDPGQPADFDAQLDALSARYGKPLPPPGNRHDEENTALTVAAIIGAVLVIGLIIAIVTHGHGGGHHEGHVASGVHAAAPLVAAVPPAGIVRPMHVHEACWIDFAALQLADASVRVAVAASAANAASAPPPPPPPGGWMAEWRTPESDVMLFGVELGTPRANLVVTYRSLALAPPPQG